MARLLSQPTLVFEQLYMYKYYVAWAYLHIAFALFEDFEETQYLLVINRDKNWADFDKNNVDLLFELENI